MPSIPAIRQGMDFNVRFGEYLTPQPAISVRQSFPSQDTFTRMSIQTAKPLSVMAEQDPARLVNYFKNTFPTANSAAQLTLEDAKTMLPYFLSQGHLQKSEIEYCFTDPKNKTIHLILAPEDENGHSNMSALVDALDGLQNSSEYKQLSKTWAGKETIDYNPIGRNFTFLGYRVNAYEGIEGFMNHSNPKSFWNSYFFNDER